MKNKKFMMALATITMCATSAIAFSACAHKHDYQDWQQTKAPTCTEEGVETGTCPDDGETMTRPIAVDPNAHAFGDWNVTEPTYNTEGVAYKTCLNSAEHTVEVKLPKLSEKDKYKSITLSDENDPEGEATCVYEHALGDITFTVVLGHYYSGEITLVHAPTFDTMGYATQKCAYDDSLLTIYLPRIIDKDKYDITETTGGLGTYTFTHVDGETVSFDAIIANADANEDTIYDAINDAYSNKGLVGKAEGTLGGWDFSYAYNNEEHDYIYIVDPDGVRSHYFENGDHTSCVVEDSSGTSWHEGGLNQGVDTLAQNLEGFRFAINSLSFSSGNYFYGIESLVEALYNHGQSDAGELNDDFAEIVYTNAAGETVYMFSFSTFKQFVTAGNPVSGYTAYVITDHFYKTSASFTLSATGMLKSADITVSHISSASYEHLLADGEEETYVPGRDGIIFDEKAVSDSNPIRGYDTGKFFIMPDEQLSDLETVHIEQTALADIAPEDLPENPYAEGSREVTSFELWTAERVDQTTYNNTVESDTVKKEELDEWGSPAYYVYTALDGTTFNGVTTSATSLKVMNVMVGGEEMDDETFGFVDYKVYLVEDGTETELAMYGTSITASLTTRTRIFAIRARAVSGDFILKFVIGNREQTYTYRNNLAAPTSLNADTYLWSDIAGDYVRNTESGDVSIYADDIMYFNSYAPMVDGDCLADGDCTISVTNGATISEATFNDQQFKTFSADQSGTYVITFTSTVDASVRYNLTVKVLEVPAVEDVLSGDYQSGVYSVQFGNDNKVTVTDGAGTAIYSYSVSDNIVTLTRDSGTNAFNYGMKITKGHSVALTYTDSGSERELVLMEVPDPVYGYISGSKWSYSGSTIVFNADGETLTISKSGNSDEQYSYKLTEAGDGRYNITFTALSFAGGYNGIYTGTSNEGSFIVVENGEITQFTLNYDNGEGGSRIVEMNRVYTVEELLSGSIWYHDGVYVHFIDGENGYATQDADSTSAVLGNDYLFTYSLNWIEEEGGFYDLSFASNSNFNPMMVSWFSATYMSFSSVFFNGSEITAMDIGGNSMQCLTDDGDDEEVDPVVAALAGTVWTYEIEVTVNTYTYTLEFGENGRVTYKVNGGMMPVRDSEYTFSLVEGENGVYSFVFEGSNSGDGTLILPELNEGSTINYDGTTFSELKINFCMDPVDGEFEIVTFTQVVNEA